LGSLRKVNEPVFDLNNSAFTRMSDIVLFDYLQILRIYLSENAVGRRSRLVCRCGLRSSNELSDGGGVGSLR
jgi:hypothetical protein